MQRYITDKAEELREAHGGHWGQMDRHPIEDWRYEVANNDTRLGYWEWGQLLG